MSTVTTPSDSLTFELTQQIQVDAPLDVTFAALLEQMGPANETPEGVRLPMVLEDRPGGRWYRDLGGDNGHLWGHVQSIKRPTLLEICGPLFMSQPVANNVQYRLSANEGGTLIRFRHSGFGLVTDEVRARMAGGWLPLLERVRARAAARR